MPRSCSRAVPLTVCLGLVLLCGCAPFLLPEQRTIDVRDPAQIPAAPPVVIPLPETVSERTPETAQVQAMSLDDAIHIALANSKVVRVLAGVSAVPSGQTIYDPAIAN